MQTAKLAAGIAAGAVLFAAAAGASLPAVEPPESYAKPGPVRKSIERMRQTLADRAAETWTAQRGAGICEDAARRLRDYTTSRVYTPGLGEKLWRECHEAYTEVD